MEVGYASSKLVHKTMTTNIAKCINAIIKSIRELLITVQLEYLRGLVQEWNSTNKNITKAPFTKLAKEPEEMLNTNYIKSKKLKASSKCFWFLF